MTRQEYRRLNSPSRRLTRLINSLVTEANVQEYARVTDKLVFCADLLGATLTTDSGERTALRLENKLARAGVAS